MKWMMVLLSAFLLLYSVGCSNNSETNVSDNQSVEGENVQPEEKENVSEPQEEPIEKPDKIESDKTDLKNDKKNEDQTGVGYKDYRPDVGTKRTFTENGTEMFSEEIIAENDEYIQILVSIGGSETTEIYKWTDDEITLVLQSNEIENPTENILETFQRNEHQDKIIGLDANWNVVDSNLNLTVPSGTYNSVIAVEKVTEEVVGEKTTYKRYYAPGSGLIKEIVEVTGENGYKGESSLENIKS